MTRSDRPTSPLGGDQDGLALVALAEDLEEQFCSSPGKWNQTQFVDDQQAEARQIPPEVEQSFFIPWPPTVRFTSAAPVRRPIVVPQSRRLPRLPAGI